ncbi:MAG: hypothetical protein JWP47_1181 [Polaromonas sp.]|nr:hypothetical protein [Polaromonas sp.]
MISLFKFLTVTAIAASAAACGGGGGSPGVTPGGAVVPAPVVRPLFTSAASQITLSAGPSGAQTFAVGGGAGPYIATSSNAAVVSAVLTAGGLRLTGLSVGSANVLVVDSTGATLTIAVVVPALNNLALFTTAPAAISIPIGEKPAYSLGGGSPPYSVASSNAAVVTAGVSGNLLTVNAVSAGSANLAIRDSVGGIVSVSATVPAPAGVALFTTAPAAITVAIGAAPNFVIGGGNGNYTVATSNASVATVAQSGGSFTVTGLATGSSNIVVRDSLGATVTIPVTVPSAGSLPFFTTAPSNVTVGIGAEPAYGIGGGSGPYTASTSNTSIAIATVNGSNLFVRGIATGTANVVVRDSTGALITISVLVGASAVAITPNSATGIIGDTLVATLTGGTPPYRASVGNILVAAASMSGNTLTVRLQQVGQTVVTVLDANDQSIAYSLTVNAATPGIRLSPNPVVVSEKGTETVSLTVFGASAGPIEVFSSDVSRLVATIDNATRVVSVTTPTNRCVDSDTPVTITVVDSSRATGVATITIRDNGPACP